MKRSEESVGPYSPNDIVADAMMMAYWRQLEYPFVHLGGDVRPGKHAVKQMQESTVQWTQNKCRWGSIYTLGAISAHPAAGMIDQYALICAYDDPKYGKERVLRHSYFLVSSGDTWFAGSPANITLTRQVHACDIASGSLDHVVQEMNAAPLSQDTWWPDSAYIGSVLAETIPIRPDVTQDAASPFEWKISCLSINRMNAVYDYGITTVRMDFRQTFDEAW